MLTQREIISTLEMLKNENLDVRTVTLGVSLLDCAGSDLTQVRQRVADRICRLAGELVPVCERISQKYGIPVVNKRVAVSPIAVVGAALAAAEMVELAHTLDAVAREINVDFIGGFSALVEKGMARGDRALIAAIPEALSTTERLCASVNVASTRAGINMDAVILMGQTIKRAAGLTADRDGAAAPSCACSPTSRRTSRSWPAPISASASRTPSSISASAGPGVVKNAIDRALASNPGLDLGGICRANQDDTPQGHPRRRTDRPRGGEQLCRSPFGVVDLSLAPTPNVGDSVGEILPESWAARRIGAPGSTAALALLNDAVKKGGALCERRRSGA